MEKHLQPSFHNFFLTPMAQMHSQALLALWVRLCHLAMTSWALFPERKVQSFPTDVGNFCFGPRRKKWVGKRIALVCYLSVSFHSCCSNLQAGNRGLGHFDIFDLQGGQKRWMLPLGDMLLYLILEKKDASIFIRKLRKGIFLIFALQVTSDFGYSEIHFHINPVPWLYTSSRHCIAYLHWDWFYIEGISEE